MPQLALRLLNTTLAAWLLVSCGGGGGGSSTPAPTTFVSTDIVAGCSGLNCSAASGASNTYLGTGTGVWRFDNSSEAAVVGDINIQNVSPGKTVTLIFSNGQSSTAAPTAPAAPESGATPVPGASTTPLQPADPVQVQPLPPARL